MGTAARRDRDRKHLKEQILEAAMELFRSKGFEQVTMRRIAAAIEYSTGAIYRHFAGKNDIYFALRQQGFDLFYAYQMRSRDIEDPWERAKKHAATYLAFALENPAYYDLMFVMKAPMEQVKASGEWTKSLKSYELMREDIEACMAAGYIPGTNPDIAAIGAWSLLHGAVSLYIRDRFTMHGDIDAEGLIQHAVDYVLQSLLIER